MTQQGASHEILATKALAPAPKGGTIADGTWVSTSAPTKLWGSSSDEGEKVGTAGAVTLEIKGSTLQGISTGATSGKVSRRSGTITTSGTELTLTETCHEPLPDGGLPAPETGGYTATPTTLSIYIGTAGTAKLEFFYTKK